MPLPSTTIKSESLIVEYRENFGNSIIDIYGIRGSWMTLSPRRQLESESEVRTIAANAIAIEIAMMLRSFETIAGKTYFQFVEDLNDRVGSF
jgi:hypothetical protein